VPRALPQRRHRKFEPEHEVAVVEPVKPVSRLVDQDSATPSDACSDEAQVVSRMDVDWTAGFANAQWIRPVPAVLMALMTSVRAGCDTSTRGGRDRNGDPVVPQADHPKTLASEPAKPRIWRLAACGGTAESSCVCSSSGSPRF